MRLEIVIVLWSVSGTVSGVGYELIKHRLEYLEERFSEGLDRLLASVSRNEAKIDELEAKLTLNSSSLTEIVAQNLKSLESQLNTIKHNISEVANNTRMILQYHEITSCKTPSKSGMYKLQRPNLNVYCEMETFGGGWLVIQQRIDDFKVNFNRSWYEYRDGFGVIGKDEEFWLGNEAIHQITSSGEYELAIELKDKTESYKYARFSQFHVAGEDDKYRLTVGGYSGNLANELSYLNSMQFSTYDSDNDATSANCAYGYGGGWWYNDCGLWALNRRNPSWDYDYIFYTRMMIRRK